MQTINGAVYNLDELAASAIQTFADFIIDPKNSMSASSK
jgi:hypothetical protein